MYHDTQTRWMSRYITDKINTVVMCIYKELEIKIKVNIISEMIEEKHQINRNHLSSCERGRR